MAPVGVGSAAMAPADSDLPLAIRIYRYDVVGEEAAIRSYRQVAMTPWPPRIS